VNLNIIPSKARNLLFVLGVRFLAPLEMTDTTVQIMLLWLYNAPQAKLRNARWKEQSWKRTRTSLIRMCEETVCLKNACELLMKGKFLAVVAGQSMNVVLVRKKGLDKKPS
jgi:hypothetical protein